MGKPTSVAEYIASQPSSSRGVLASVRGAIRKALPRASEELTYNMPTYKIDGRPVLHFAAWKKHFSIYPVTEALLAKLGKQLAAYEIENVTVRFPYEGKTPTALITRIAKLLAAEMAPVTKPKARASRGRAAR